MDPKEPKVPIEELKHREYWTCDQCARILGRGDDYWRCLFDQGKVQGYRDGGEHGIGNKGRRGQTRYILADSARDYLKNLQPGRPLPSMNEIGRRKLVREWRKRTTS